MKYDERFKIRQCQLENEAAQRLLDFLMQENVMLKNRLASLLYETTISAESLYNIERCQERLLQSDEVIGIMRRELAGLEKMLIMCINEEGAMKTILHGRDKLRKDLYALNLACAELKSLFNGLVDSLD